MAAVAVPWSKVLEARPHAQAAADAWRTDVGWELLVPEEDLCGLVAHTDDLNGSLPMRVGLTDAGSAHVLGEARWVVRPSWTGSSVRVQIQSSGFASSACISHADASTSMRDAMEMIAVQAAHWIGRPLWLPRISSQLVPASVLTPMAPLVSLEPSLPLSAPLPQPNRTVETPPPPQVSLRSGPRITAAPAPRTLDLGRLHRIDVAFGGAGLYPCALGATSHQRLNLVREISARRKLLVTQLMSHYGHSAFGEVGTIAIALTERSMAKIREDIGRFHGDPWNTEEVQGWFQAALAQAIPSDTTPAKVA